MIIETFVGYLFLSHNIKVNNERDDGVEKKPHPDNSHKRKLIDAYAKGMCQNSSHPQNISSDLFFQKVSPLQISVWYKETAATNAVRLFQQ